MGYQKYVKEMYKNIRSDVRKPENKELKALVTERKKKWRHGPTVARVERPTRIDAARRYGYKSKQGFVVARVRVRTGGARRTRPIGGRRPKRLGVNRLTPGKSIQRISEERCVKRFPNMEVLGSYWIWEDGQYQWHEVVMVDPHHPVIKADRDLNWICEPQHKNIVFRGLTPQGRKERGLTKRGKGAEKVRPSIRAKGRRAK
jgi:large subunit ribosomal protein L15e